MDEEVAVFASGVGFSYQLGLEAPPACHLSRFRRCRGSNSQTQACCGSEGGAASESDGPREMCGSVQRLPRRLPLEWMDATKVGKPKAVSAGAHHSVLLTEGGTVYRWGMDAGEVYPAPSRVVFGAPLKCIEVACGRKHTLALLEGGFVFSFGIGYFGQLGHGDSSSVANPRLVRRLEPSRLGDRVVQLAAGGYHSAVRTNGGAVFAWGFNRYGQCGHDDKESTVLDPSPVRLDALRGDLPAQLVCGRHHCALLTRAGAVYSWGAAGFGRLGIPDTAACKTAVAPVPVPHFRQQPAAALAAGDFHMLALGRDGAVFSWGYSQEGQGGHGGTLHLRTPRHIEFFRGMSVAQIACGAWHSTAITADGDVYAWGSCDGGWSGLPLPLPEDAPTVEPGPAAGRHVDTRSFDSEHNALLPRRVAGLNGFAARQLACGGAHTLVLAVARPPEEPEEREEVASAGGSSDGWAKLAFGDACGSCGEPERGEGSATSVETAPSSPGPRGTGGGGGVRALLPPWATRPLRGGAGGGSGLSAVDIRLAGLTLAGPDVR